MSFWKFMTECVLLVGLLASANAVDIPIDWDFPGADRLPDVTADVGDNIVFTWSQTHNVWLYEDDSCTKTSDAIEFTDSSVNTFTFPIVENLAGTTLNFVCEVVSHCQAGMKLRVIVTGEAPTQVAPGTFPVCNICPDGEFVTISAGEVQGFSCDVIEQSGLDGQIAPDQCALLAQLQAQVSQVCGCSSEVVTDEPTPSPTSASRALSTRCGLLLFIAGLLST